MTYTHLTTDELVIIESYFKNKEPVSRVAWTLKRSRQTINKVYCFFKQNHNAFDYYQTYKRNKANCGRSPIVLPDEQRHYVQGWSPDVIVGRAEIPIVCSIRTLYRMFKKGFFQIRDLPMKGKQKPNGYHEKRGKQAFKRTILDRSADHEHFLEEFGHLEGDTIVGFKHKSAVITLAEQLSKVIITLKPCGRQATDIEKRLDKWFESIPRNLFKSITFDCGKEFSN
ncbi:hypothetical protein A5881_003608 [Enterococcus termitis]|nr:integrase [Enterococcus termitis]